MGVRVLLTIFFAVAVTVGVVAVTSARDGTEATPAQAPLFKSHAKPSGITELETKVQAAKGTKHARIVYAFSRTVTVKGNNGRFVRLVCPKHSSAIGYQEATRARNIYVDYSAIARRSNRKWDIGFENLNASGKALVKPGVVCAKGL